MTEIEDIAYIGTAERVNRLRIVAHHADVILRLGEFPHQHKLDIVRILVLVHQHILKLLLVPLLHFCTKVHQTDHVDQQVIKIHRVGGFQSSLIERIDGSQLIHTRLAVFAQQLLVHSIGIGTDPAVLRHRDTRQHRRPFVDLLVQPTLLADSLDDRFLVGRIVDREIAGEAQQVRIRAYQTNAHAVERTHHQVTGFIPYQFPDPLFHLAGGFVGESQRHDSAGGHTLLQQVRDTVRQYTGLTRPCTCYNQRRTFRTGHRCPLGFIQLIQKINAHSLHSLHVAPK